MQTHAYLEKLRRQVLPVSQHLRQLAEEAARLEADGHHPIGAGIRAGRPCIELAPTPRLAAMASRGEAAYFVRGRDEDGAWRRGTLVGRRVTAFWTERGN